MRFQPPLERPGLYHGAVGIVGEDDFPPDDRRWLAFEARRPDRILLVDGDPGPSVYSHETYYLETALRLRAAEDEAPPGGSAPRDSEGAKWPTPYDPVRLDAGVPGSAAPASLPDLSGFSVVVLCNLGELQDQAAEDLAKFVTGGGRLLIFTGDRVRSGAYSRLHQAGVLPAQVQGPEEPGVYRLAEWSKDHPIFEPFDQPEHGDLRALTFARITRLVPEPGARPLASAEGKRPLIVEGTAGRGRCLIVAAPADNAWGDWAVGRLYLPLIHQLVGYLAGRVPASARVRLESASADGAKAAGVAIDGEVAVVRNIDQAESDLERTAPETLREAYRLPFPRPATLAARNGDEELPSSRTRADELWRWVLSALLVVLVVEAFVANRTYA